LFLSSILTNYVVVTNLGYVLRLFSRY